jgi:vacuolar-type H+-ATPase subunit H
VSRKDRFRPPRTPAREAAERIEAVVEAAERAAESVIDDAERQARDYLAEAQAEADRVVSGRLAALSQLTDTLHSRAEAIRRETEDLLAALDTAKAEIDADSGGAPVAPAEAAERRGQPAALHLRPVAEPIGREDIEPPPSPSQPERRPGTPAGARLLATQMAVSGNSREEISLRLRNGFDIDDTASILDAILGPED